MREIKFRGLTKTTAGNRWVYGYYYKVKSFFDDEEAHFIETIKNNHLTEFSVDKKTIGQYTGLKDKNGKEIYEGDILRFSDVDTAIVQWNSKYASFIVKPIQDYYFDSEILGHAIEYSKVEVIGNIYENSNLLKD